MVLLLLSLAKPSSKRKRREEAVFECELKNEMFLLPRSSSFAKKTHIAHSFTEFLCFQVWRTTRKTHTHIITIDDLLHSCSLPIVSFYLWVIFFRVCNFLSLFPCLFRSFYSSRWHRFSMQFHLRSSAVSSPSLFGWHAAKPNAIHGIRHNSAALHRTHQSWIQKPSKENEDVNKNNKLDTNGSKL